jgi:DNA-binding Xre family transcriptional regulator
MDNKLKITNVIIDCGLSSKYTTAINNDENMELATLEKICLFLNIKIEQAVEFV